MAENNDHLVQSADPEHPANLIPELCKKFYQLGWVTGRSAETLATALLISKALEAVLPSRPESTSSLLPRASKKN